MRTIVAGSRSITDYDLVCQTIDESGIEITELVCGLAPGVDSLGKLWAEERGIPIKEFPADWVEHGKAAGVIRNQQMAEYAEACIVIHEDTHGSLDMITRAKRANLTVVEKKMNKLISYLLGFLCMLSIGYAQSDSMECPKHTVVKPVSPWACNDSATRAHVPHFWIQQPETLVTTPWGKTIDTLQAKLCAISGHDCDGSGVTTLMYCPPQYIDLPDRVLSISPNCNSTRTYCRRCGTEVLSVRPPDTLVIQRFTDPDIIAKRTAILEAIQKRDAGSAFDRNVGSAPTGPDTTKPIKLWETYPHWVAGAVYAIRDTTSMSLWCRSTKKEIEQRMKIKTLERQVQSLKKKLRSRYILPTLSVPSDTLLFLVPIKLVDTLQPWISVTTSGLRHSITARTLWFPRGHCPSQVQPMMSPRGFFPMGAAYMAARGIR